MKDVADVFEKYMISLNNNGLTNINIGECGENREGILGERSIITQEISDKDIDRAIKNVKLENQLVLIRFLMNWIKCW